MNTSATNIFPFVSTFMNFAYTAPTLSASDAACEMSTLAAQIRASVREIPRDRGIAPQQVGMLKLAMRVSESVLDELLKARPELRGSGALDELSDALDDLDNQIENHEIALEVGPRVAEVRASLAGLTA